VRDEQRQQLTIYQLIVAAAMLANAIVGHFLYRAAFADAAHQPTLAATVLALGIAGIAVQILLKPVAWALDLARGAAVGMLLAVVGIGLLAFVAANFESGFSRGGIEGTVALMLGLLLAQLAILLGCARIDRLDVGATGASIARGALRFWLFVLGVSFGAELLGNLLS
jgi:hypothetical protein